MTYSVDVEFESAEELQDAHAWLLNQGLKHIVDWRWFRHGAVGNYTRCTFQFDDARYADWFTLRFSECIS